MIRFKGLLIVFMILFSGLSLLAQKTKKIKGGVSTDDEKKQKTFVTIGPEVSLILPTDFGARPDKFFQDTMFRFSPNVGYRFGASLRFDFSRTFSFQTGLYYISRTYTAQVGKANATKTEIETDYYNRQANYIGFEIPIMALFYVQLGRKWFMNNAVGFSIDFYPSSIVKNAVDSNMKYVTFGGRNSWCMPAMKAAIGFEHRSENSGYFYLGGQFHRPFSAIMDGFIERTNVAPYGLQSVDIAQSGTYFAIDFKYFFPPGKKNKWTESNK
jgi:hypothetical protein